MTTSTTRKPAKPRPADTCRLSVTSRGVTYTTRPIRPETSNVIRAWRLRKADGRAPGGSYTVADTSDGATCDCADQTFRHDCLDATGCKHIRALRALGLSDDEGMARKPGPPGPTRAPTRLPVDMRFSGPTSPSSAPARLDASVGAVSFPARVEAPWRAPRAIGTVGRGIGRHFPLKC